MCCYLFLCVLQDKVIAVLSTREGNILEDETAINAAVMSQPNGYCMLLQCVLLCAAGQDYCGAVHQRRQHPGGRDRHQRDQQQQGAVGGDQPQAAGRGAHGEEDRRSTCRWVCCWTASLDTLQPAVRWRAWSPVTVPLATPTLSSVTTYLSCRAAWLANHSLAC